MRVAPAWVAAVSVVLLSSSIWAQQAAPPAVPRVQIDSDALTWVTAPNGIQTAAVVGDPTKPGVYVTRLRFPKGTKIAPHLHPDQRVAVILSGSMYFGYGEVFDEAAAKHLSAGATWTEPPSTAHFAWARDEDAIVQVVGIGPSGSSPARK